MNGEITSAGVRNPRPIGPFTPPARSAPEDGTSPISTMGWMENGQGDLGVTPWQDVARYARNSPMLNAERITAPVLMIHGDLDFVALAQGEEMFSALYRQDKDAVLVRVELAGDAVCHEGYRSCFFRRLEPNGDVTVIAEPLLTPEQLYGQGKTS